MGKFSTENPRKLRDIPNQDGFELVAVMANGSTIRSKVCKSEQGLHSIEPMPNPWSVLNGWLKVEEV